MLDEERNHDAILNVAIDNGFWLRACDLYLNGFIPNDDPNVLETVKQDYKESPPASIKDRVNRGRDGLLWNDDPLKRSKGRKTKRYNKIKS